jgi:hypothetical protein
MRHVVSAIYRFWWCRNARLVAARAVGDIQKEQLFHFCRRIDKLLEKRSPTPEG